MPLDVHNQIMDELRERDICRLEKEIRLARRKLSEARFKRDLETAFTGLKIDEDLYDT